jgi:hypothetical protein
MSTTSQIEANRSNAQKSTGPTTEAGKQKSSQNATRHGFTGLALIVTPSEKEAYEAHVQSYMDHHKPADHMHRQIVQQYADLHWSLHQIFVQQSNTMSLMNAVSLQMQEAGDPMATAAALAPIAKTLSTLNLYETRRRRALKTVQEELFAREQAEAEAAAALRKANKTQAPAETGFVRSAPPEPQTPFSEERIREMISFFEAQGETETVAELRKLSGF